VPDALREELRKDTEPSPDLEHHVVRRELRRAPDHVEQVVVDQEVLAEVAIGPDVELAQAAQAGLPRRGRLAGAGHQPKTRAALRSTIAPSSAYETLRSSATRSAV
jgi:hypothetical protein